MNTSSLIWVEELIVWLFDHEEEFIEKFCKRILFNADNIFISSNTVFVRDNFIGGNGNNAYIPINEVIAWVGEHKDGY